MLGLDNPIHILFLLILLLLVFGAKRLPEMGRSLGSGMRGFKDSLSGDQVEQSATASQPAPAAPATLTAAPAPVAAPTPIQTAPAPAAAPVAEPVPASFAPPAAPGHETGAPSAA